MRLALLARFVSVKRNPSSLKLSQAWGLVEEKTNCLIIPQKTKTNNRFSAVESARCGTIKVPEPANASSLYVSQLLKHFNIYWLSVSKDNYNEERPTQIFCNVL